jgi:hypothetical protein
VFRAPGNFHIGHHAFFDMIQMLDDKGIRLDNSFKINHLSFGALANYDRIKGRFPLTDIKHPLDTYERINVKENG